MFLLLLLQLSVQTVPRFCTASADLGRPVFQGQIFAEKALALRIGATRQPLLSPAAQP
jgi:hypothetical protein